MKRTLLITMDYSPMHGGVATYWSNLCRQLPAEDIVVLAPEFDDSLAFDAQQKYIIYRKNLLSRRTWMWPKWLPFLFAVWRIVRREHIQKVIVAQALPGGTIAYIIKKLLRIPYVVSFHGLDVALSQQHPRKRALLSRVIRAAESLIVNSQYTKTELEKIPATKNRPMFVIYPCPNRFTGTISPKIMQHFKQVYHLENRRLLITVSRLIERKGHDVVLQSLPQVKEHFPSIVYGIVGQGPERSRLEALTQQLHVEGTVLFLDDLLDEDLPYAYSAAELFVMPARQLANGDVEGFGIVYLEANSFGKPVIGGRSGGVPEAVQEGVSGLIVAPLEVNQVAHAIISLLQNPQEAALLGAQGRQRVDQQFTWEKQAKTLISILEQ